MMAWTLANTAAALVDIHGGVGRASPRTNHFACRGGRPSAGLFDGLFGAPPPPQPLASRLPSKKESEKRAAELGVQQPAYSVLRSGDGWEVRKLQPMQIVQCTYEKRPEGYELLGGYAQRGENTAGLGMPATAPCLMMPLARPKRMWYMLPSPHTPLDPDATPAPPPLPLAADVLTCKSVPSLVVGVACFAGYAVPDVVLGVRDQLAKSLRAEGLVLADGAEDSGLMLAQYNELFALPWARENEVWLPLREESVSPPDAPPPPPPPPDAPPLPPPAGRRSSPPVMVGVSGGRIDGAQSAVWDAHTVVGRRVPAVQLGWLDALTDSLLGEAAAPELTDGCAETYGEGTAAEQAAEEAAAAAGFDGETLAGLLVEKWGVEYDVEFTRTDYLGVSSLYVNVFPWSADQKPWRHADRQAYLEHCQAMAELLVRWGCVAEVKRQIAETDKVPRRGTIPLKTVPIRLTLPNELVKSFRK